MNEAEMAKAVAIAVQQALAAQSHFDWTPIIVATTALVTALGLFITNLMTVRGAAQDRRETREAAREAVAVSINTAKAVDGSLTAVKQEIREAGFNAGKVDQMEKQVAAAPAAAVTVDSPALLAIQAQLDKTAMENMMEAVVRRALAAHTAASAPAAASPAVTVPLVPSDSPGKTLDVRVVAGPAPGTDAVRTMTDPQQAAEAATAAREAHDAAGPNP